MSSLIDYCALLEKNKYENEEKTCIIPYRNVFFTCLDFHCFRTLMNFQKIIAIQLVLNCASLNGIGYQKLPRSCKSMTISFSGKKFFFSLTTFKSFFNWIFLILRKEGQQLTSKFHDFGRSFIVIMMTFKLCALLLHNLRHFWWVDWFDVRNRFFCTIILAYNF